MNTQKKQYVVRELLTATDDNPNFAGQTQEWYCTKDRAYTAKQWGMWHKIIEGWKRKHFAEMFVRNEVEWYKTKSKYWTLTEIEIIEI